MMSNIHNDIALGCTCKLDCVSNFSAREVYDARKGVEAKKSFTAIREWIRAYLLDNKDASSEFGHSLHLDDKKDKVCVVGFEVYYGLAPG